MEQQAKDSRGYAMGHPRFAETLARSAGKGGLLSRSERLDLFFEIANEAAAFADGPSAKAFLDELLDAIEDAFSGIFPGNSANWRTDGRMYPADEDYRRESENPQVAAYDHLRHLSYFGANGSFRFTTKPRGQFPAQILIDRPGQDGRTIDELND
jgi:hypothetical protein